ncbi:THAP domain-containing protein 1-like [Cydia pomonella]|uniref:THAP domain-containing protein 1-like n=1 Tax=Cydia pomonella TaxID=82600 RepID=UPI002ADDA144|nr:THAP domain-containing protein 1-like [Cydia pomonella]
MVGCSVVTCKSNSLRKEAGVTFHAFPTEDEIVKEWIAGTGKSNWMPHKYSRICSKHFEQHCVRKLGKRTFIEKFSVPTLFIHKFPVSHGLRAEPSPIKPMDCQSQPAMHEQVHSMTTNFIECSKINDKSVPIMTTRKLKLTLQLNQKTLLAESRRKKIEALRSKSRRLQKRNAELAAILEDLQKKDLLTKNQRTY